MTSFNAFGQTSRAFGNMRVPVWLGTVTPVPIGGSLDKAFIKPGALYPAGTPISLKNKVIKPVLGYMVKSVTEGVATVSPVGNIMPEAGDKMYKLGSSFDPTGAVAVTACSKSGEDIAITISITGLKAGDVLVLGEEKPNSYLYNDIYIGDIDTSLDTAGASGSAVMYHSEGILIDRTPASGMEAQMAAAVPGVLQVNG